MVSRLFTGRTLDWTGRESNRKDLKGQVILTFGSDSSVSSSDHFCLTVVGHSGERMGRGVKCRNCGQLASLGAEQLRQRSPSALDLSERGPLAWGAWVPSKVPSSICYVLRDHYQSHEE